MVEFRLIFLWCSYQTLFVSITPRTPPHTDRTSSTSEEVQQLSSQKQKRQQSKRLLGLTCGSQGTTHIRLPVYMVPSPTVDVFTSMRDIRFVNPNQTRLSSQDETNNCSAIVALQTLGASRMDFTWILMPFTQNGKSIGYCNPDLGLKDVLNPDSDLIHSGEKLPNDADIFLLIHRKIIGAFNLSFLPLTNITPYDSSVKVVVATEKLDWSLVKRDSVCSVQEMDASFVSQPHKGKKDNEGFWLTHSKRGLFLIACGISAVILVIWIGGGIFYETRVRPAREKKRRIGFAEQDFDSQWKTEISL